MSTKPVKLMRKRETMSKLGLSESSFDDLRRRDPTFPLAVALSQRSVCFVESEVDAWIESRPRVKPAAADTAGELEVAS
jgi:prophage regulatory protein